MNNSLAILPEGTLKTIYVNRAAVEANRHAGPGEYQPVWAIEEAVGGISDLSTKVLHRAYAFRAEGNVEGALQQLPPRPDSVSVYLLTKSAMLLDLTGEHGDDWDTASAFIQHRSTRKPTVSV